MVSTVKKDEVIEPQFLKTGVSCLVKTKGTIYKGGIIAGIGKFSCTKFYLLYILHACTRTLVILCSIKLHY